MAADVTTMLTDSDAETLGFPLDFPSTWRTSKAVAAATSQTEPLSFSENETQTVEYIDAHAQTDPPEDKGAAASADPALTMALTSFLAKVCPLMEEQLDETVDNRLFDEFVLENEEEDEDITCAYRIPNPFTATAAVSALSETTAPAGASIVDIPCTGVDWNCNGTIVAASYGSTNNAGWDTGLGGVASWSLFKRGYTAAKPDMKFEIGTSFMSIAFHPKKPAICAVGSFAGELVVLNVTNKDDNLLGRSKVDDYFHREPITDIQWVYDYYERDYQIASVSGDGKVLFWSLKNKLASPIKGFLMTPKKRNRFRSGNSKSGARPIGGVSVAFSAGSGLMANAFVSGSEGGQVHRCFLKIKAEITVGDALPNTTVKLKTDAKQLLQRVPKATSSKVMRHLAKFSKTMGVRELSARLIYKAKPPPTTLFKAATEFAFTPHIGPVYGLDCSPFHRNVFASCGGDGQIRISSLLQATPLLTIDTPSTYLFDVKWSRFRPLVFACAGQDGGVYVYDLHDDLAKPVAILRDKDAVCAVQCLSFNPKQRNMVACGDNDGNVKIWRLSWKLSNALRSEKPALTRLAENAEQEDDD